jgi:DNA-binding PadR family transcriptional regulator
MSPQITAQTQAVLGALLAECGEPLYGLEISRRTRLSSGTLYPILARLEKAGWVSSEWEAASPTEAGRPRRRYYRLTGEGAGAINARLEENWELLKTTGFRPRSLSGRTA